MCGIFGAFNSARAAEITFVGLHEIQHRAKEFAGIVTWDKRRLYRHAGEGIAQDVFSEDILAELFGRNALGHIRYSTVTDNPEMDNTQPLVDFDHSVAICHNGNITNTEQLRCQRCTQCTLQTSIDTELILERFCQSKEVDPFKRTFEALKGVEGTYSLIIMWGDTMIAVRDPWGNRPLSLGSNDGSWFIASETVSFQLLGIEIVREIEPGEILVITNDGLNSRYFDEEKMSEEPIPHQLAKCIFELLYYASPASIIFGIQVILFRLMAGKKLHKYYPPPANAETVMDVPDSARYHAKGYADASPYLEWVPWIMRHHYIGRTFIEALQKIRVSKIMLKFIPIAYFIFGKIIVLVDDSIVRLNTLPVVVKLLRMIGVKEIHVRIPTPRIKWPCHFGIDTPTRKELAASDMTTEEIREKADVDSLEFMTVEQLKELVSDPENYCFACMNGKYPIPIKDFNGEET